MQGGRQSEMNYKGLQSPEGEFLLEIVSESDWEYSSVKHKINQIAKVPAVPGFHHRRNVSIAVFFCVVF